MDILEKVFLLALLKKEEDEDIAEIKKQLVNTGSMSMKEAKKIAKTLQENSLLDSSGNLTFTGTLKAQEAEKEFTLR